MMSFGYGPNIPIEESPGYCLEVSPGYQQFPARCVHLKGHTGPHCSHRSNLTKDPVVWANEDDPFTFEE